MFESSVYRNRRKALREKVSSGIILILGNNEAPANYPDNTYKFRQDSSFLYFFGHSHPGYAGVLDVDAEEDYFFGDDVTMDDIIWMGPQPSVKELGERVGVKKKFSVCTTERSSRKGHITTTQDSLPASLPLRQHDASGRFDRNPCFHDQTTCFIGADKGCSKPALSKRSMRN